jgi:hypothetical protein
MYKRQNFFIGILLFLCTITVVTACGNETRSSQLEGRESPVMGDGKQSEKQKRPDDSQNDTFAEEIQSTLQMLEPQNEKGIVFRYTLKNETGKDKDFQFTSGQKFDYVIKDETGNVVYQYSQNHMFMQMLSSLKLKQGETFKQDILVKDLESGTYELEIWLTPKGETEDYRQKITFIWN